MSEEDDGGADGVAVAGGLVVITMTVTYYLKHVAGGGEPC